MMEEELMQAQAQQQAMHAQQAAMQAQAQNVPQQPVPVVVQNQLPLYAVFEQVNTQLKNVSDLLTTQGVKNVIPSYDGTPKNYSEWIKSIEKYRQITGLELVSCKMLAYQTSTGAVSSFIDRYLTVNDESSWADMKNELSKRFGDITDSAYAMSVIRTLRQKPSENVQLFNERIMTLAERAFDDTDSPVVQIQLVDIFVTGLLNDSLKMCVLRKKPTTLEQALNMAMDEVNLKQRLSLISKQPGRDSVNLGQEPMDVSHMRPIKCYRCGRMGHGSRNCRVKVQAVTRTIVCWGCGGEGHIIRDCKITQQPTFSRPSVRHSRPYQKTHTQHSQRNQEN